MYRIDEIDNKIIEQLEFNARASREALAISLNTSAPTIRRRIRNLLKNGIINILAVVNPFKIGLSLAAITCLEVESNKVGKVRETLKKNKYIQWVVTTTGRFDIVIFGRFPSNEEFSFFLENEIAKMPGIRHSESSICLKFDRMRFFFEFGE